MLAMIAATGVELRSSGDLVSTFHSVWTPAQREEHARASALVKDLAGDAFRPPRQSRVRDGESRHGG